MAGVKPGDEEARSLTPLKWAEATDRPFALMNTARIPLQPGLRPVANVAREEVSALKAVGRVGVRGGGDHSARSSGWILPGLASVLVGLAKQRRRGGLGVGEVHFGRSGGPGGRH